MECIFCRIAAGQIPVVKVAEDDTGVAFPDVDPKAPVHLLVVPKQHFASLQQTPPEVIGKLHALAVRAAKEKGLSESGFRTVINTGPDANQTVFHLHVHVLGGRKLGWPPG